MDPSNVKIPPIELADGPHAADDEDDDEEEGHVRDQAVDAQHDEDRGIVAGEVAQVVVDARLHIAEVLGLRQPLDVEEVGERLEIGKPGCQGLRPHASELVREVQPRREDVEGDLYPGHREVYGATQERV